MIIMQGQSKVKKGECKMSKEECCQVNKKDADYLCKIIGDSILQEGKGTLLNIVEGCGLPDKQEQAVKRLVVDWLHQHERFLVSVVNNLRVDKSIKSIE